jgi:glycosyltransferase involved in cell wall biosynthesis
VNVLVFNLGMDVGHTALGFTTSWTNALARRTEHVTVITMFTGRIATESNVTVYSLGKERGWSEPRRLVEFYRLLYRILRKREINACFAHMAPLFAALFTPVSKARGIPILLWYAHGSVSRTLRIAHRLADRCVTSTPDAFRLHSDKLFVTGQGIDTNVFRPPGDVDPSYEMTAISIGRLSPTKRVEEMLAAMATLRCERGIDLRLELTGGPLTAADDGYVDGLRRRAEDLGIAGAVTFAGSVGYEQIASRYHRGWLFLNLSETGSLDKAILESMASGCVPISRNESFRKLVREKGLGFLVPGPGPDGLADSIVAALRLPPDERSELVRRLRTIVQDEHSLDALSDKLVAHLAELAEGARR